MVHSGTANVGTRLNGRAPRGARAAPSATNPSDELLVRTPVPTAPTKSTRPAMLSHATCRRHVGAHWKPPAAPDARTARNHTARTTVRTFAMGATSHLALRRALTASGFSSSYRPGAA